MNNMNYVNSLWVGQPQSRRDQIAEIVNKVLRDARARGIQPSGFGRTEEVVPHALKDWLNKINAKALVGEEVTQEDLERIQGGAKQYWEEVGAPMRQAPSSQAPSSQNQLGWWLLGLGAAAGIGIAAYIFMG